MNSLLALVASVAIAGFGSSAISAPNIQTASSKTKEKAPAEKKEADKKDTEKKPEVVLDNVANTTAEELVKHPHEFLNRNVKFNANFFAFSNLALDYPKPPMKPSKTYLSLLVLAPGSRVPLSELKLAMLIPKDKDPETELLSKLKDGDQIEIIGKEFSTALDDPWVEIFKLKKIGGSKEEEKKVASESSGNSKSEDKDKEKDKAEQKSESSDKSAK
jgi:hypothetical protein